ncbi:MAG: Calx-beta domain-containing protein, partial [Patescibacteria group bacterium]
MGSSDPFYSDQQSSCTWTGTCTLNQPTVQFTASTGSGSESVSSVLIGVSLSYAYSQPVTVQYAVTGGTAAGSGVDYTVTAGTLTIPAGSTSGSVSLSVVNDTTDEVDETVQIGLANPVYATLGSRTAYTYTIFDNDTAPYMGFNPSIGSGQESITAVSIPVLLSAISGKDV